MGDSAGLVSPFSGEGLSSALMSASLGSKAVVRACEDDNKTELKRYEIEVRNKIVPRLTAASLIGPWLHWAVRHFGHERLMSNFGRQERLVDACAGFSGGELSLNAFAYRALPFLPFMLRSVKNEN
jgi:2-polyprenyl-6-methoxyphenol hydroxylase-like FAD-dependent oxidoreductase